ncbi:MAG: VOC family protein, partial [Giesbergeria sp.]
MSPPAPCVDHLVVLAADLASGAAWCERTLGVAPAAGGEHPLMGTHNRLLQISSPAHPRAYLEIIAINLIATPAIPTGAKRWFDMDCQALQAQVAQHGPRLIHWVAAVPDAAAA